MSKILSVSVVMTGFLWVAIASGAGPEFGRRAISGGPVLLAQAPLTEAPAFQPAPPTAPGPVMMIEPIPAQGAPLVLGPVTGGPGVELYPNVRYRAVRNVAPCALPMIVTIKDPCSCEDPCCPPKCVNVEICVPQCPCPPKVTTSLNGRRTRYDFGKFAVNIISRRGLVIVDYDD